MIPIEFTTGHAELDQLRRSVLTKKTSPSNYRLRILYLKLWATMLQQAGIDLTDYVATDQRLARFFMWNTTHPDYDRWQISPDDYEEVFSLVDKGYAILEGLLRAAMGPGHRLSDQTPVDSQASMNGGLPSKGESWPLYQANPSHTGTTDNLGPQKGELAWKVPTGLPWYSRPVLCDDQLFVASPGVRTILKCYEPGTGRVIWQSKQLPDLVIDQLYSSPCYAGTPSIVEDKVYLRNMGSRGNIGPSNGIAEFDRATGEKLREIKCGHVDYRTGHPPMVANKRFIATLYGVHDIELTPPVVQPFNRLVVIDRETEQVVIDFMTGHMFNQPVLTDDSVFIGTHSGYLYCIALPDMARGAAFQHPFLMRRTSPRWSFHSGGSVDSSILVQDRCVVFGSDEGFVYCLDERTGRELWHYQVSDFEPRAFRQFSKPVLSGYLVCIGAANGKVYILKADDGTLLKETTMPDWVRSQPAIVEGLLIVADLGGNVRAFDLETEAQEPVWSTRISEFMILADLVSDGERIFVADADLMLHCLDTSGMVLWRDSILDRTTINGIRVNVDQIAGGAYYQSKPTVAEGKVFVGTPSRFVYAIDESSGQLCWKFEFGGAISAAPNYDQGRLFLGQQGGEDDFYCLDARSGELCWRQSIGWVWGSSNVAQGRVFVPGIDGFVNCLDAQTGAILWRYRTGRSTCTEPVIDGDIVFFGGWDGYLHAFDIFTGEVLWEFHLGGSSDSGAQIAREGLLYVPLGGGKLRCIDHRESVVLWEYAIDRGNFNASPAFDGERLFFSAMQGAGMGGIPIVSHIHCLDAASGELIWAHPGGGLTAPAVAQDKVYFGSTFAPYFTCVDARGCGDGSTRLYWKYQMGGKVEESCTALANGRAYLQASDGYLYAIC